MFKKLNAFALMMLVGFAVTLIFNACKKDDNGGGSGTTTPTIADFNPKSGTNGTVVTISGTNFTGATAVKFGSVAATTFTVVNATTITATVGAGATGDVTVTTASGTATKGTFTYNAPPTAPTITSFTPTAGTTGVTVTISGTNLTGATAVKFGNVNASSFNVVNATTITAVVGTGATGKVSVTTSGGTSTSTGDFTFNTPPGANTIAGKINTDAELTQIKTGVTTANLGPTLSGTGPFTLFAPVDAALNALTINFGSLDQTTANNIIRYHTVAGRYLSSDIPVGTQNLKLLTINSPADSIFVTKVASGTIYVNGKNVDDGKKDISADNGVIHKLNSTNGILLPPTRNVYDQISVSTPNNPLGYDSIKKLVDRAAQADANLVNILKNNVVTLIAPTNQAFQAFFSAGGITQVNQLTAAQALTIVKDHILLSRNFVINLVLATNAGPGVTAFGGSGLKIGSTGTALALYYSPTAAVLLGTNDIMCFNGVIQRVGGILTK